MRSRASRLFAAAVLGQVVVTWSVVGVAQESSSVASASASDTTASASATTSEDAVRVAVVLVGDPNEAARLRASQIEESLSATFRLPADPALRASLAGETEGELIAPVVRDRRALGGSEREDLPLLAALGDRADVVLLLVVRSRAGSRELVAFDVRHRAFFEGAIDLEAELDAARLVRFVRARARAAESAQTALPAEAAAELEARALSGSAEAAIREGATGGGEPADEPEWIELNWPYLVAGALLAGAAAFVIVYTTNDSDPVPMLRFRPGGTP